MNIEYRGSVYLTIDQLWLSIEDFVQRLKTKSTQGVKFEEFSSPLIFEKSTKRHQIKYIGDTVLDSGQLFQDSGGFEIRHQTSSTIGRHDKFH
jgi:hypothetical protein